jgi:hypothetical protein
MRHAPAPPLFRLLGRPVVQARVAVGHAHTMQTGHAGTMPPGHR